MTIFDILKLIALDREAGALSSASPVPAEKPEDELSEEDMDFLNAAAGQRPYPPNKKPTRYG